MSYEGAPRYSLILETVEGGNFYYDMNLMTFVRMGEKSVPYRGTLYGFDILTSNFDSKEQIAQMYGINEPIKRISIRYNLITQFNKILS